jgi:hypothetical protein
VFLPRPRGDASDIVFERLLGAPRDGLRTMLIPCDPWSDDFQILLWVLQQMDYRRFSDVDPEWERHPSLRSLRDRLERTYEAELRARVAFNRQPNESVPVALTRMMSEGDGPSLSSWVEQHATLEQLREFVMHRAAYQVREADPHSFAIPRLAPGRAKRALLKMQLDEYGNAEPGQSHAELFRVTMDVLDAPLDVDALPAFTLRTNTLLNLFAGSRRLLGECLGHLAAFEMCSVEPMARYAAATRRLLPADVASKAARFYDVHVAADGWHEQLAVDELVDGFAQEYPDEADGVLFGAAALSMIEREFTEALLDAWESGESSLRTSAPSGVLYLNRAHPAVA